MSVSNFALQGEIRHVDVKNNKEKRSALVFVCYGNERTEVEGTNFVNGVIIRVGGGLYERAKDLLKEGNRLTVNGHLQGILDGTNRNVHMVAGHIEMDAFSSAPCLNQVTLKGEILSVEIKPNKRDTDKKTALLLIKNAESNDPFYVNEYYVRVPSYRYEDVKAKLRVGAQVLIQGRVQGVTRPAMMGDGMSFMTEVIAERLSF